MNKIDKKPEGPEGISSRWSDRSRDSDRDRDRDRDSDKNIVEPNNIDSDINPAGEVYNDEITI